MKWSSTPDPKTGDTRTLRRFAVLPWRASDGFTYWLEWMTETQLFGCWWDGCGWSPLSVYPEKKEAK